MHATITETTDPALAIDADDLMMRASRAAQRNPLGMEYNFAANDVMGIGPQKDNGECMMIQLALIDCGQAWPYVPSAWIRKAFDAGWRFKGKFYKVAPRVAFELLP